MSNSPDALTLDLGLMRYTTGLKPNQTLHKEQVKEVLKLIETQVDDLASARGLKSTSDNQGKAKYRHQHQGILIQGRRGAGKTTLMLTVRGALDPRADSQSSDDWETKRWREHVYALPPLDPTLVEGDEVFLGTIIANILRALRDKHGGQFWVEHPDLRQSFEALATSLRVLEPKASAQAFKDAATSPDLFAERLLSNALSGLDLAACVHDFCIEACRALGVRLLLQPLDDADVSIREGWDVLETVRRYLSNAQILPVMLGDLSLFRLVIEQEQLKRLETVKDQPDVAEKVAKLSEQYLLKLLRPERRVRLPGAIECLEAAFVGKREVLLSSPPGSVSGAQALSLAALLRSAGEEVFGIPQARPSDLLALFSENIRESRGVLMWLTKVHQARSAGGKKQQNALEPQIISSYLSAFSATQVSEEIPLGEIDALIEGRLDPWIRWLAGVDGEVREPLWVLDLLPDNRDAEPLRVRTLKFAVAGILYLRWQAQRAEQLRYFGTTLAPMTEWPEPGDKYDIRVAEFRERLRLGRGEPSWLTAARATVNMIDPIHLTSASHTVFFGPATRLPPRSIYRQLDTFGRVLVALQRSQGTGGRYRIGLKPWLDTLANGDPPTSVRAIEHYLMPVLERWQRDTFGDARLILSWFKVVARRGSRTYEFIDPWKGIAGIGDLVRAWARAERPDEASQKLNVLESILRRMLAQSELSIPVIGDDEETSLETIEQLDDIDVGESQFQISEEFLKPLVRWLDQAIAPGEAMAPHGWAQVARRFGDNLNRINQALNAAEHSAGADLERWVLAFLNNLLYVEAEVRGKAPTTRGQRLTAEFINRARDATGSLERVPFSTNLGKVEPRELPVFHWIAQCPLLTAALAEDWRNHLQAALNRGRPDGETQAEVTTTTGDVARIRKGVDVHTTLCALVPRFKTDEKKADLPGDLPTLRAQVRQLLGWARDESLADQDSAGS